MTIIYHEDDANLNELLNKRIGVIGYSALARPAARNIVNQGLQVVVGAGGDELAAAQADGYETAAVAEVVRQSQVLLVLVPDDIMTALYMGQISPNLRRGHTLIFSSAYNVAFRYIEAPPFVDVGLVAPRTITGTVRERFSPEDEFYSFVAVGQDASHHAWQTVLAVAYALGALRYGAVEINIEQEAEISLFLQQAVLPAFHHLMLTAARQLIGNGYPSDAVLLDLYLGGKFSDYLRRAAQYGLIHTLEQTPRSAQYATFSRLDRFKELKLERLMEITLGNIRDSSFAHELAREQADGYVRLEKLYQQQQTLDLWELEQQTLDLLLRNAT